MILSRSVHVSQGPKLSEMKVYEEQEGTLSLEDWQEEAFVELTTKKRSLLTAPTGAGKSVLMSAVALYRKKQGQKCLIVVPQNHISHGFFKKAYRLKDGTVLKGVPDPRALFLGDYEGSTVSGLIGWFGGKRPDIAITSSQTLNYAFKKMQEAGEVDPSLFSNTVIFQDEVHHVSGADDGEVETAEDEDTRNGLGWFYSFLLSQTAANVVFVSATHFRGDGRYIVSEEMLKTFDGKYERRMVDHFNSLGLEYFNYECVSYLSAADRLVERILDEKEERHIVLLPAIDRRSPLLKQQLLETLKQNGLSCLDLVTTDPSGDLSGGELQFRKDLMNRDSDDYNAGKESAYNVIIAVNLVREGTNWVPATRLHDLAPSKSNTRTVQTVGRLLRQRRNRNAEQKKNVAYYAYFQYLPVDESDEKVINSISDRVNVGLAGMVAMDYAFNPVEINWSRSKEGKHSSLPDAINEYFGPTDRSHAQFVLFSVIEANWQDREAPLPQEVKDQAVREAMAVLSDPSNALAKREVLKQLADKYEKFTSTSDPRKRVRPFFPDGGTEGARIREEGFNETKALPAGLLYETVVNTESLDRLDKVVEKIKESRHNPLVTKLQPSTKENKKKRDQKKSSLRRKAKKKGLSAEDALFLGRVVESATNPADSE